MGQIDGRAVEAKDAALLLERFLRGAGGAEFVALAAGALAITAELLDALELRVERLEQAVREAGRVT